MEKFNTRTRIQADTVRASRHQVEMDEGTQYLTLGIELGGMLLADSAALASVKH